MNIIKSNNIEDILAFSIIPYEILTYTQKVDLLFMFNFDIKKILGLNLKDLKDLIHKRQIQDLNLNQYKQKAVNLIKENIKFITPDSNYFPFECWKKDLIESDLKEHKSFIEKFYNLPFLLFYDGKIEILKNPRISIVGTRKPFDISLNYVEYIVKTLNKTVVSGFAIGVDYHAHLQALNYNIPTIAVFGCGTNIIYPKQNLELYSKLIKKDFLILSEFPPDTLPKKYYFPIRNRIIAGLSDDLLCVQAGFNSGALITAKYAKILDRRIFAFYPIDLKGFEGNRKLFLNNEAKLLYGISKDKYLLKNPASLAYSNNFQQDKSEIDINNESNFRFEFDLLNISSEEKVLLKSIFFQPYNTIEYYKSHTGYELQKVIFLLKLLIDKDYIISDKFNRIYPNYKNISL